MFLKVSNHHAPLRTIKIKGRAVPWINDEIVDLMKKRDNIHKRAVALHSSSLFNEYRQIRNLVTKQVRISKKSFNNENVVNQPVGSNQKDL